MAQTNVMVSYAPARWTAAPERKGARDRQSDTRWGTALAGVFLAGGAVFALGTFVRPDGSLRESGHPSQSSVPLAEVDRAVAPEITVPLPEATPPQPQSSPLPYLAVVRDVAPSPIPPAATRRPLSAPTARGAGRVPRHAAMRAAVEETPVAEENSTETAALGPPPTSAPVAGQRRDLEGFLGEQGLVLAAPPPPSEGVAPVTEWTPREVATAGVEAPSAAPLPTAAPPTSLAATEAVAPAPSDTPVIEAVELPEAASAPITADLVEAPATPAPEPVAAADATRLARIEPIAVKSPSAAPVEVAAAVNRDDPSEAALRLAVVPVPPPTPPSARVAETPAAIYAQSYPLAVVNGEALGAVTLRDLGPQGQTVHLGALVGLLKLRMPEAEFVWLSNAAAADQFVTLDRLRAAGITIQFDARDGRLLIDAR